MHESEKESQGPVEGKDDEKKFKKEVIDKGKEFRKGLKRR